MLLRCRNWAGAPATRNLCILVLAELLAVLPGVPLWSVSKWDFESQTLSAPRFSIRLRDILLFDGISSKLAFSFQTREITQASKLVVSWRKGMMKIQFLSFRSRVPFLGYFHQLAPQDPRWQQFIDENPNQMSPSCGAKASRVKKGTDSNLAQRIH